MFRKIISSVGEMGELESLFVKNLVCSSDDLMWIEAWHCLIQYHSFHLASYLILFGGSESCYFWCRVTIANADFQLFPKSNSIGVLFSV